MPPKNTYLCLNKNCVHRFDAPAGTVCPRCGGDRVKWLPVSCNIATGIVKQSDMTLRTLVDEHNERVKETGGQRIYDVKPERGQPTIRPATPVNTSPHTFQTPLGGWGVNLPRDKHGNVLPSCVSVPGITAKQTVQVGQAVTGSNIKSAAGMENPRFPMPKPIIEARHRG